MGILKSAVLLSNEHQSDQKKNVTNDFLASRRILTKMTVSVFHRIGSNI